MIYFCHTCIKCGKNINPERLEVLSNTRICKACAEVIGTDFIFERTEVGMDIETYKDLLGAIRS
ncbi:MAG: TraR/DksA C4-type zinc finger protein [Halanaerobiaceae bacterium]